MCGIGGIYLHKGSQFPEEAGRLWELLEDRGTHAAGVCFAWNDSDKPVVFKKATRASNISSRLSQCAGANTLYAFFHTRYTTQGSTANNGNNHPVVSNDIIVTHNGVIRDGPIFDALGVDPIHQVDTEAINASLRHRSPSWMANNIRGSMSIAWVDITQNHETVNLFTNGGNPLVIARLTNQDVVWASTLEHIEKAGFTVDTHFNATPYKQYQLSRTASGEVLIDSWFVSEKVATAQVSGMYRHTSSYARNVGYTSKKSKKKSKKSKATRTSDGGLIYGGMRYDPVTQTWKNW